MFVKAGRRGGARLLLTATILVLLCACFPWQAQSHRLAVRSGREQRGERDADTIANELTAQLLAWSTTPTQQATKEVEPARTEEKTVPCPRARALSRGRAPEVQRESVTVAGARRDPPPAPPSMRVTRAWEENTLAANVARHAATAGLLGAAVAAAHTANATTTRANVTRRTARALTDEARAASCLAVSATREAEDLQAKAADAIRDLEEYMGPHVNSLADDPTILLDVAAIQGARAALDSSAQGLMDELQTDLLSVEKILDSLPDFRPGQ